MNKKNIHKGRTKKNKKRKEKNKEEIHFKFKNDINKSYSNKLIDSLYIYYNNENRIRQSNR